MQGKKTHIDSRIKSANIDKSVVVVLTGNGKGKSSSALGMIIRALGWGQKVVLVSFLKGEIATGERNFLQKQQNLTIIEMQSGFTWESQNKELDIKNAENTWQSAEKYLQDESIDLMVFDELTYMFNYGYLDNSILDKIKNRVKNQSVIITGRAASIQIKNIADTISEIKDEKHAFNNNIMARKGVDF